jgi:hypothetical protein
MGLAYNPKSVTDGLVLCLDAANPKSYPGSGTLWSDLSGNTFNGLLVNGAVYNSGNAGSISFDGVNDHATFNSPVLQNQVTVEVVVRLTGPGAFGTGWIMGKEGCYRLLHTSNTIQWVCATVNNGWYTAGTAVTAGIATTTNLWLHIVCTYDGSLNRIYINGALSQTGGTQISGNVLSNGSQLNLMRSDAGSISYGSGLISAFKMYQRALTLNEIQQNFNAVRGRYGI